MPVNPDACEVAACRRLRCFYFLCIVLCAGALVYTVMLYVRLFTFAPQIAAQQAVEMETRSLFAIVAQGDLAAAQRQARAGVALGAMDASGWTLLHVAAAHGQHAMAAWLLEQGLAGDRQDLLGQRPLDLAVLGGHAQTVALLQNATANTSDAMRTALRGGDLENLTILAQASDVGAPLDPESGQTLAHLAAMHRQAEVLRWALQAGGNLEAADTRQRTALHHAALAGGVDCVDLLIDAGARVDVVDAEGFTPLELAVMAGHAEVVTSLLAALSSGQFAAVSTSLVQLASDHGQLDVMELLIQQPVR